MLNDLNIHSYFIDPANAVLDASGVGGTPAELFEMYLPNEFQGFYDDDDRRFRAGQPNAFDLWDPAKP